jgi:ATP-dependent Lon protease
MSELLNLPDKLIVPVFPLPNAILFPGAQLPLYIFEPRYKRMIDDTLAEHHFLSVALMAEKDGEKTPAEISGLGLITDVERLPKNEKNILVIGLRRVKMLREVSSDPYISAEVTPLAEILPDAGTHERLFATLRDAVRAWLFRMRTGNVRYLKELGDVKTLGELCDFFGAYLLDDFATRQSLLEELDVARRAEFIVELVRTQLYYYSAPFEN